MSIKALPHIHGDDDGSSCGESNSGQCRCYVGLGNGRDDGVVRGRYGDEAEDELDDICLASVSGEPQERRRAACLRVAQDVSPLKRREPRTLAAKDWWQDTFASPGQINEPTIR